MTEANPAKLKNCQSWKTLQTHYESIRNVHLRTLFEDGPKRGEHFTLEAAGLFLDYSKNRISDETVALLCQLATECDLASLVAVMITLLIKTATATGRCRDGQSRTRVHIAYTLSAHS